MSRWSVFTVRVLVVVAFALILLFQVLVVPWRLTPDLGHADSSTALGKRESKGWL